MNLKFWKKKKEVVGYPYNRAIIVWTDSAEWKGINDDMNKVIKIIEGNKVVEELPYHEILAENIEKIRKIPIDDLTLELEEIEVVEEINPVELKFRK